jgi:rhodanese-related sulfurtransferase
MSSLFNPQDFATRSDRWPSTTTDTRELHELQETGWIPGAIHIPIVSAVQSFHISDRDFLDMMGYKRPSKNTPIVLYCKAGVRARNAAGLAVSAGYTQVGVYKGSWVDWIHQNGPISRDTSHYQVAPEQPKAIEMDPRVNGSEPSDTTTELAEEVDYETFVKPTHAHRGDIISPMGEEYGKDARRKSSSYLGHRVSNESDGRRRHKPPTRRGVTSAFKSRRPY